MERGDFQLQQGRIVVMKITVTKTALAKCERCWRHIEVNPRFLCERCEGAVQAWEDVNGLHPSNALLDEALRLKRASTT